MPVMNLSTFTCALAVPMVILLIGLGGVHGSPIHTIIVDTNSATSTASVWHHGWHQDWMSKWSDQEGVATNMPTPAASDIVSASDTVSMVDAQTEVAASTTAGAAPASTLTPTAAANSTTNSSSTLATPSGECKCGYSISSFNNAYYPYLSVLDASTLSSTADLGGLGWSVTDAKAGQEEAGGIGGPYGDVRCVGKASNIRLNKAAGALELVVPGGQGGDGSITGAEMAFNTALLSAHVTMDAQLSNVVGSCQSIFTYHDGKLSAGKGDELDIEVVGLEKGIQVTNWDPNTPSDTGTGKQDSAVNTFTTDASASFNKYSIAWSQGQSSAATAQYLFNGKLLPKQPTKYASTNPSKVILNNWSNGDPGFTAGPPTADVVMSVKMVTLYYTPADQTPGVLIDGCQQSDVCVV